MAAIEPTSGKKSTVTKKGASVSVKNTGTSVGAAAASTESIYSARLTLREWLTALENANLLKPGATLRILTNRKLKRVSLPASAG